MGPLEITKALSQSGDQSQLNVRAPSTGYKRGSVSQSTLASGDSVEDLAVDSMNAKAKPRQLLHLPSFRALGFAVPQLDSLLTPPNEDGHDLTWSPSLPDHLNFSSELHCPRCSTMSLPTGCSKDEEPVASFPEAPDLQATEETPNIISLSGRVSEVDGYFATGGGISTLEEIAEVGDSSAPGEQSTTLGDYPGWLQQALEIVGERILTNPFQRVSC